MTTITVCTTCRIASKRNPGEGQACGEAMLAQIQSAANDCRGVQVRGFACLMGCDHSCNVAVSGHGKLTYVLGSLEPNRETATAIVEYAVGHRDNDIGKVPFRDRPRPLRGHFVARIPPLLER